MKIAAERNDVTSHGIISTSKYKINATAKSFKILYSSPYKNKIRAVIRELSCNAYDSHVAANKKEMPFQIHCPSVLEPYFSVKDFGTGLSKKLIEELYVTYFLSTKDASNEFVGALGIGSKSPYAYTDSYTIVSNYDLMKYTYIAAIGEDGEPSCNLVSEIKTDEPNGLEVIVPVQPQDFKTFEKEIINVLKWFAVKPNTNSELDLTLPKPFLSFSSWNLHSSQIVDSGVIMGGVFYPIDTAQLKYDIFNIFNKHNKKLVINADIGDVDITVGREELSYDKNTISWLNEKIIKIRNEYIEYVNNLITNAPTLMEALKIHKMYKISEFYSHGLTNKYKSHMFSANGVMVPISLFENKTDIVRSRIGSKTRFENIPACKLYNLCFYDDTTILFDDDQKGNVSKLRYFLKCTKNAVVIFPSTFKSLLNEYSDWNLINISELPKEIRIRSNPKVSNTFTVFDTYRDRKIQRSMDIDNDSGFYIEKRPPEKIIIINDRYYQSITVYHLMYGLDMSKNIIVLNKTNSKKIKNHPNWKPLDESLKQKCEIFLKDNSDDIEIITSDIGKMYFNKYLPIPTLNLPNDHLVSLVFDKIKKLRKNPSNHTTIYKQIETVFHMLDKVSAKSKYNLFELYPLLEYAHEMKPTHITEYIQQCDLLKGLKK